MSRRVMVTEPPPLSLYRTQWRADGDVWQPGLDFGLGFFWDSSHQEPQPVVQLMGQALMEYATLSVDANRCLMVVVDLTSVSAVVCTSIPQLYLQCVATLTADGESFTGAISQLCSGSVKYNWRGRCDTPTASWRLAMTRWCDMTLQRSTLR